MGPNIYIQIFNVIGSIFTGIALGIVVVSYMVYPIRSSNNDTQTDEELTDEEQESSDSADELSEELVESDFDIEEKKRRELIVYNNKLFDELSKMDTRELTLLDLEDLHTKVVEEDTPYGKVIMTYNHTSEAFWWYSDSVDSNSIVYKTLDTVARVFAITHDCKKICINYKEEFLKEKKRVMELLENDMKECASGAGASGAGASASTADTAGSSASTAGSSTSAADTAAPIKIDDPKYAIIVNNKNRFINKELTDLHKKIELKPVKNVLDDEMGKMSYADFKKNYKEIINKVKEE
jgi:hypothetical protein